MSTILTPETPRYHIQSPLGEGMSSVVYRAQKRDSKGLLSQFVAVKIFKSLKNLSQLRDEFQALVKVRSKHCVAVWGWESFSEGPALILEYVDGVSLERISRHGMNFTLIFEVLAQIQQGLQDLANHGLYHGDLSPNNVLIARDGTVKLVDFGLVTTDESLACFGSPGFLAPERLQGELPDLSSDLYALGLIYHWLCDRSGIKANEHFAPLMAVVPEKRRFVTLLSQPESVLNLSRKVVETLAENGAPTQKFALSHENFNLFSKVKALPYFRVAISSALFCMALGGVYLNSFMQTADDTTHQARVQIRSENWTQVFVDGEGKGYAPLDLKLSAGSYVFRFQSSTGIRERQIQLKAGEVVRIRDSEVDLTAHSTQNF